MSILREKDDGVAFEILRNEPVEEAQGVMVSKTPPGILTVGEEVKVVSYGRDLGVHWVAFREGG